MTGKDYEITVTIKNNRLLEAMERAGIKNAAELSRATGVSQSAIGDMLKLSISGENQWGKWRPPLIKLSEFLRCMPEDLVPVAQVASPLKKNSSKITASLDEIESIAGGLVSAALPASERLEIEEKNGQLRNAVDNLLGNRQAYVIKQRFGIDCEPKTLEELGNEFNVSKDRIRQIEAKALLKLKGVCLKEKINIYND